MIWSRFDPFSSRHHRYPPGHILSVFSASTPRSSRRAIEAIPIVRDGQDRTDEVVQGVPESSGGGDVEVVGRLVEQQEVGPREAQQGQLQARALAA
jgi:hypothetical protein